MLRNIPNKYTQNSLLEEIHEAGFADTYDFFYLPMDVHNRANVGYAFVNFLEPADFDQFSAAFTDYVFQKHPSLKIARVSPAHIQGLVENLRHFSNRAVTWSRNSQYRPIVRYQGVHRDLCELLAELPMSSTEGHAAQEPAAQPELLQPEQEPLPPSSHLNPEAAEFVPCSNPAGLASLDEGSPGAAGRTGLRPDAGVFVPQAMLAMPDMSDVTTMGVPVELDEPAVLDMTEMLEMGMGVDVNASIYPDADGTVAPPPGLEGSSSYFEGACFIDGSYFGLDSGFPGIEQEPEPEFVPPPGISHDSQESSFTLDKHGFEEAVSRFLHEGRCSPSAGGSSSTRSSSNGTTPRSVGTPAHLEKAALETA